MMVKVTSLREERSSDLQSAHGKHPAYLSLVQCVILNLTTPMHLRQALRCYVKVAHDLTSAPLS